MYLVWINPPTNFAFSDDSIFLKKNLGGGHKFSEFACCLYDEMNQVFKLSLGCWSGMSKWNSSDIRLLENVFYRQG